MSSGGRRPYRSRTRERQAEETRARILDAALRLMRERGFDGTTIDAIARAAGVAAPTVYRVFGSKRGIVAELLDRARFGAGYRELTARARESADPRERLRFSARIARQVYDAERATLELLRGAAAVSPELAALVREDEGRRRELQASLVRELAAGGHLRSELDVDAASDVLWMLTSRDVYRMLVVERGWSPARYEEWLGEAIERDLLAADG